MRSETVRTGFKIFGTIMFGVVGGGFVYVGLTGGQPFAGIAAGVLAAASIAVVWWRG